MRRAWLGFVAVVCLALGACSGPAGSDCPNGKVRDRCIGCGRAGGCAHTVSECQPLCSSDADCAAGRRCSDGACAVPATCI